MPSVSHSVKPAPTRPSPKNHCLLTGIFPAGGVGVGEGVLVDVGEGVLVDVGEGALKA